MAGSYLHVTTDKGKLRNPNQVAGMLDSPGDVFEAIEEMYGMIWYLASELSAKDPYLTPKEWVNQANLNYGDAITNHSPGRQKSNKELR